MRRSTSAIKYHRDKIFRDTGSSMSSAATRMRVLTLYKQILREATKFTSYNYRHYFLRRTKDAFRENKGVTDGDKIKELINLAEQNLTMLKRQVLVGQLYGEGRLIIESKPDSKP